MNNSLRVFTIY